MNILNIFRRIFKIGAAEAHSVIEKLEDPIKMTEQGIRELKEDLDGALHSLAEVKAMSIRARNDEENNSEKARDYENKAMLLLQKAQRGELDAAEADRLAAEALTKKSDSDKHAAKDKKNGDKFGENVIKLEAQVKRLRSMISKYENELKTLKARSKVTKATKNLNKQLAEIDSSSTVSMLERMKEKVETEEALAESYGDIANEARSLDEEIDQALEVDSGVEASSALTALKEKMGISLN